MSRQRDTSSMQGNCQLSIRQPELAHPPERKSDLKFFYCKDGPDGDPVLMIGAELDDARVEELERRAEGCCAQGELVAGSQGLIFEVEPDAALDLERDIKDFFSRKVSALQSARVVSKMGRQEHDRSL